MVDNYGRYRSDVPDVVDRIAEIERRLSAVESVSQLGNATINKGTLQVRDANGDIRVKVGLLSDGVSYGMEVKETGQTTFYQVPFVYTQTVPATPGSGDTCSSTTYADLATPGPTVTVPVRPTGRILVQATAQIQWTTAASTNTQNGGRFDVAFSGANTRTPNETNDPLVGVIQDQIITSGGITNSTSFIATVTAASVFENLNSGLTTITMKYRNPLAGTNTSDFFRRTLTVFAL